MAYQYTGPTFICLSSQAVFAFCLVSVVASIVIDLLLRPKYPGAIPRVGYAGPFSTLRNVVGYYRHFNDWAKEGYEKYSKNNRAFVVPSALYRPSEVILPKSQTRWMVEQPDSVLSNHEANAAVLFSEYNFLGKKLAHDMQHVRVIHKFLARNLPGLIPGLEASARGAMDRVFGMDTERWRTVNVWEAWLDVVPVVTNFMLVGKPVCDNEEFLKSIVAFTEHSIFNSVVLGLLPRVLHPLLGHLLAIPNWWHWRKSCRYTLPVIKQRLHDMARKAAQDPAYSSWKPPEDFLTWSIHLAMTESNAAELDPVLLSKRLLPIEFAAMHTTVLTAHAVLLDLTHADPSLGIITSLRAEAAAELAEAGGHWTKAALSRLHRLDSAIRESQRFSNLAPVFLLRKVVARDGVTTPEGWHLPHGAMVGLNMVGVHHDICPDAYDAFRFSRQREESEEGEKERDVLSNDPPETPKPRNKGMVSTSDAHLAFGHGRHACPGRFFVAHELKMALTYLLLNYEIRATARERPRSSWIGVNMIPPVKATIEIRRRRPAEKECVC